jgi:hypothetical protein
MPVSSSLPLLDSGFNLISPFPGVVDIPASWRGALILA